MKTTLQKPQMSTITRWGLEVFFRHLKQTFGRRKLRSHAAQNAEVELQWSLVGLWAICLYASRELVSQQIPLERLSIAQSLRAFRRIASDSVHPQQKDQRLRDLLRNALRDEYPRTDKTSRDYPRKKQERPAGKPKINKATKPQIQTAQNIKQSQKG